MKTYWCGHCQAWRTARYFHGAIVCVRCLGPVKTEQPGGPAATTERRYQQ